MIRVGVFSDSHGDHAALDELLEKTLDAMRACEAAVSAGMNT